MRQILVLVLFVSACTSGTQPVVYEVGIDRNVAFTDILNMDVFSPEGVGDFPAVVLFHGGSWYGGDRTTMEDFAFLLARKGLTVFNATYTTGGAGGGFPGSYEDIWCALATAGELAGDQPLAVVGYSAGAHLASTVVMAGDRFRSDRCTATSGFTVGGFVGLAGPYEADRYGPLLVNWFGTTIQDDPDRWQLGSPYGYLESAQRIPIVLVHGDLDQVVQLGFTYDFESTLRNDGFDVSLTIIEGADHTTIVDPLLDGTAVAEIIYELASLAPD